MQSMRVQLAVFDIDGTLLYTGQPLSPHTMAALHDTYRRGISLALASSRPAAALDVIADTIKLPMYRIAYNGAYAEDLRGDDIMTEAFRVDAPLLTALQHYQQRGGTVHLYDQMHRWIAFGDRGRVEEEERIVGVRVHYRTTMIDTRDVETPLFKALCQGQEQHLGEVRELLAAQEELNLLSSGRDYYDIHPVRAGKCAALTALCKHLQIGLDEVAAFGDSDSDAEMLAHAGLGVAVGDASARARTAASVHLDGPGSGALEDFLRQLQPPSALDS